MIDEKKKKRLIKYEETSQTCISIIYLHCGYKSVDVATSQKTKDQHRSGRKPTLSTDPDRRNQLAGWQSIRAGWRYIETHSDAEDTNPRFIPSFTEYPDSEDNSCTAGNLSRDRNDDPTIRSDGRLWRLMTNPLVKGRHSDDRYRWLQLAFINGS